MTERGATQEALLNAYAPGQTITIQVDRGGATQTLTVTLS